MAKDENLNITANIEAKKSGVVGGDNQLRGLLAKEYQLCQDALRYFSLDWNEFEDLLFVQGRTPDQSRVRLSEGSLSSIVRERSGRVMAQMPGGTVNALGLQNQGKGLLMDLVLEKWIYPNANEQYDLETKLRMWDAYSNVYGTMPMCYDWSVTQNYTGPDCWLVPIRNFFPQQGRFSIQNCDYVYISNFVSRDKLFEIYEDGIEDYDLDAIKEILEQTAHGKTKPKARDDYLRTNPMFQYRRRATLTDTGDIEIVTKYEAGDDGRWIDFAPDFGNAVIRNIPNPHKNGRIPVVLKYAFPTLDSIIGLGDMEQGRYIQYAIDTVENLMVDGLKLRTYPPVKIVNGNVVMPSMRMQPGAKWLVSNPNDVTHHQFPDVNDSNNAILSMLKGAMSNVTGNTTVQSSQEASNAGQGKTPTAIKQQQQSESTRDDMDARFMEKAIEELFGGMINLINDVEHKDPIEFYMFNQEIAQIAQGYPDVKDAIKLDTKDINTAKVAKVTLKPSRIKNEKGYMYKIDAMSTRQMDQEKEHAQLLEIWQEFMPQAGPIEQLLNAAGQTLDFPEFFKEIIVTGGLRDWKKIIKPLAAGSQQGQMGASSSGAPQPPSPNVSLSGKMGPTATAGAEQAAGLPTDPVVAQQPVQPQQPQMSQPVAQGAPQQVPVAPQLQTAPTLSDPNMAQAQAQILAQHEQLRQKVQASVNG